MTTDDHAGLAAEIVRRHRWRDDLALDEIVAISKATLLVTIEVYARVESADFGE